MSLVRVTLATSSMGVRGLDKIILHITLRAWALLSPALFCSGSCNGARGPSTDKFLRNFVFQTLGSFSLDLSGFHLPPYSLLLFSFISFLLSFHCPQLSRGRPLSISSRYHRLPIAPGRKIKAQAGWVTYRFMAGIVTQTMPFS